MRVTTVFVVGQLRVVFAPWIEFWYVTVCDPSDRREVYLHKKYANPTMLDAQEYAELFIRSLNRYKDDPSGPYSHGPGH